MTAGSPETCYKRVQERVKKGGHDVPKEKLFERYDRAMAFLPDYLEIADEAKVYDNSADHPILVLSKASGHIRMTEEGREFGWVQRYLSAYI